MQKTLNATAVAATIIGLALLFVLDCYAQPVQMRISSISQENIGKFVEVKAKVNWISEKEKSVFFELYDGNTLFAVKFNPTQEERVLLRRNSFLVVTGKIQKYGKTIEIVVDSVKPWNQTA
ncbi:MAG: OB-fold nucleic acid binding domain-containing protein [Candidatus Diapherotrites archaeon]|nr:OB-fold nucleic acid binding domain-containing protein [Candidatus Diapherotrites archaeon]